LNATLVSHVPIATAPQQRRTQLAERSSGATAPATSKNFGGDRPEPRNSYKNGPNLPSQLPSQTNNKNMGEWDFEPGTHIIAKDQPDQPAATAGFRLNHLMLRIKVVLPSERMG